MTASPAPRDSSYLLYIGTYTELPAVRSEGIYVYRMDAASGALAPVGVAACGKNPSFVAIHPNGHWLFAVHEVDAFEGQPGGGVSAFALDPATGVPTLLNSQLSRGGIPCHVTVDASGRWLLLANYVGGSVTMLPIGDDGRLGPVGDVVDHRALDTGAPPDKRAHAHMTYVAPGGRWALAPDLGLDRVMVYEPDAQAGKLRPHPDRALHAAPGAGPRHLDFHPNGRLAYLINELNGTLMALAFDPADGRLRELQTLSTLPDGYAGTISCADVHVHPSGRYVYGSNRGNDSIVIYAIDPGDGRLCLVGHEPTQGRTPRNFALDPSGTFLLAANQDSNTVVSFRIDRETGRLTATGQIVDVPAPVCLKFHR